EERPAGRQRRRPGTEDGERLRGIVGHRQRQGERRLRRLPEPGADRVRRQGMSNPQRTLRSLPGSSQTAPLQRKGMRRLSLLALLAAGAALLATGIAAAASPVSGSIAGPVTSVNGDTFTLTSSLSPTGKATVKVTPATVVTEQAAGFKDDL